MGEGSQEVLFVDVEFQSWFIVGLGNLGSEYECMWYNFGFCVVEEFVLCCLVFLDMVFCNSCFVCCDDVDFVLLQIFMNCSGFVVCCLKEYFDYELSLVLVVYDEVVIFFGCLWFWVKGSFGGYWGMEFVIESL